MLQTGCFTYLAPALKCSIQARGSQKEPAEVFELSHPKRSFGALSAASSWFQVSIWAHLAFLVERSHSLERICVSYTIVSPWERIALRKALSEPQPTRQGSWQGASAAPGHPLVGQASCILASQGWGRHHLCALARIVDGFVRQGWHCHSDPLLVSRDWAGAPSLTLPWVCSMAPTMQRLQAGGSLVQVRINLPASTCQINHILVTPRGE